MKPLRLLGRWRRRKDGSWARHYGADVVGWVAISQRTQMWSGFLLFEGHAQPGYSGDGGTVCLLPRPRASSQKHEVDNTVRCMAAVAEDLSVIYTEDESGVW